MPDGGVTQLAHLSQVGLLEHFADQSHPRMAEKMFPVADRHTRRFLAAVLKGVKAQVALFDCAIILKNAENTAFFLGVGARGQRHPVHYVLVIVQGSILIGKVTKVNNSRINLRKRLSSSLIGTDI